MYNYVHTIGSIYASTTISEFPPNPFSSTSHWLTLHIHWCVQLRPWTTRTLTLHLMYTHYMHSHPSQHSLYALTPITTLTVTTPTICTHTHHNTHYMHSHTSQHSLHALSHITPPTTCTLTPITIPTYHLDIVSHTIRFTSCCICWSTAVVAIVLCGDGWYGEGAPCVSGGEIRFDIIWMWNVRWTVQSPSELDCFSSTSCSTGEPHSSHTSNHYFTALVCGQTQYRRVRSCRRWEVRETGKYNGSHAMSTRLTCGCTHMHTCTCAHEKWN